MAFSNFSSQQQTGFSSAPMLQESMRESSPFSHHRSSSPQAPMFLDGESWVYFELHDLMRNKHVSDLFKRCNRANETIEQLLADKQQLLQQLHAAQTELQAARSTVTEHSPHIPGNSSSLAVQVAAPTLVIPNVVGTPATTAFSDFTLPRIASPIRPEKLPFEVLWTFSDAQSNPDLVDPQNPSRPYMSLCVRDEAGRMMDSNQYKLLGRTVGRLCKQHLKPLKLSGDPAAENLSRTKTWYQTYFNTKYQEVLNRLELEVPVLQLCTGQWKADHLVGQHLQNLVSGIRKKAGKSGTSTAGTEGGESKRTRENDRDESVEKNVMKRARIDGGGKGREGQQASMSSEDPRPRNSTVKPTPRPSNQHPKSLSAQLGTLGQGSEDRLTQVDKVQVQHAVISASAVQGTSASTAVKSVDVNGIFVVGTVASLRETFEANRSKFRLEIINHATHLLDAMGATPNFKDGPPSADLRAFIERIDEANPSLPSLKADDDNSNWGHHQFTTGALTWASVLVSWEAVGSNTVACELIAATLKTCLVARHLCFERGLDDATSSYLADCYLKNILEKLRDLWTAAGGPMPKGKSVAEQASGLPPSGISDGDVVSKDQVEKLLQALTKQELKAFADKIKITVIASKSQISKADLVDGILASPICFAPGGYKELEDLVAAAKAHKVSGKAKTMKSGKNGS